MIALSDVLFLGALLFCISIVWRRPMESLFGLVLLVLGLPFYLYWQHSSKKTGTRAG